MYHDEEESKAAAEMYENMIFFGMKLLLKVQNNVIYHHN